MSACGSQTFAKQSKVSTSKLASSSSRILTRLRSLGGEILLNSSPKGEHGRPRARGDAGFGKPATPQVMSQFEFLLSVESECGAGALGRTYLLPPLSSGGASLARPLLPFPHPAHRTGHADRPHPALGQDLTPSPTMGRGRAGSGVQAGSARIGARVDSSRPYVA